MGKKASLKQKKATMVTTSGKRTSKRRLVDVRDNSDAEDDPPHPKKRSRKHKEPVEDVEVSDESVEEVNGDLVADGDEV